jgi:hypothetical protein
VTVTAVATVPAQTVPAQGLRRQLETVLSENRTLRAQVAALELRCQTLLADPRTASLPKPLVTEAAALLDRLRTDLAAVGIDGDTVADVFGDLGAYTVRLVAATWVRDGRLPADPPVAVSPLRRLEAVSS